MNCFFYVIVTIIWLGGALSTPENCAYNNSSKEIECNFTDYDSYVTCIRNRVKRQADCDEETSFSSSGSADGCSECDCNHCNQNHCNSPCSTCCYPCRTHACCYRTCHAQCTTSTCRRSCRKTCTDRVVEANGKGTTNNITSSQPHNVTTVINLRNTINITNNITWQHPTTNTSSNCCQIIGPKQCVPHDQYPYVKCYYHKKNICGSICQSGIIPAQQIIYIPQPQPKCVSASTWPYLIYGIKQICYGCYPAGQLCSQPCHNIGPLPPWFSSSGSGFSSPGFGYSSANVYPVYLGLLENQLPLRQPANSETPTKEEGNSYHRPLPPWFSSSGSGFSSPGSGYSPSFVYPAYRGLLENHLLPGQSANSEALPKEEGDLPEKSEYVNSVYGSDVIDAEVVQPTNPVVFLDDVTHSVRIKAIKSFGPVENDARTCGS